MRLSSLALVTVLLLGACRTASAPEQPAAPTWENVGAEAVEEGASTMVAIDLGRTRRVEGETVRTVARFTYSPAMVDTETDTRYDRQEQDLEVGCTAGTVRILGRRSYLGDELVGESAAVMNGMPMGARGAARMALEGACRRAGVEIGR